MNVHPNAMPFTVESTSLPGVIRLLTGCPKQPNRLYYRGDEEYQDAVDAWVRLLTDWAALFPRDWHAKVPYPVMVDAFVARAFLNVNRTLNTKFQVGTKSDRYATDVLTSRFKYTGIPVSVGWDGRMMDAQHRCLSVIAAAQQDPSVYIMVDVTLNIDPEFIRNYDNIARNAVRVLEADERLMELGLSKRAKDFRAAASLTLRIEAGNPMTTREFSQPAVYEVLTDPAWYIPEVSQALKMVGYCTVCSALAALRGFVKAQGVNFVEHYGKMLTEGVRDADDFITDDGTPEGLINNLRARLADRSLSKIKVRWVDPTTKEAKIVSVMAPTRTRNAMEYAAIVKAFNAIVEGSTDIDVKALKWDPTAVDTRRKPTSGPLPVPLGL